MWGVLLGGCRGKGKIRSDQGENAAEHEIETGELSSGSCGGHAEIIAIHVKGHLLPVESGLVIFCGFSGTCLLSN